MKMLGSSNLRVLFQRCSQICDKMAKIDEPQGSAAMMAGTSCATGADMELHGSDCTMTNKGVGKGAKGSIATVVCYGGRGA